MTEDRALLYTREPTRDDHVFARLTGELDEPSRKALEPRLFKLAEEADLTIDLARANFVDLAGIRTLVACRERARLNGRRFEIVNAPSYVARTLAMLERGHYWRPKRAAQTQEGEAYEPPRTTTTDAERSRPDSLQIVRLQCQSCGFQTFRREDEVATTCQQCGADLDTVAMFRDRRRLQRPVDEDRRRG